MRKLYRAECYRMLHSRLFLLLVLAVALISAVEGWSCALGAQEALANGESVVTEDFYYSLAPYLGVYCAAFISLFLGDEYANGTIRNKLIAGHSRGELYLSYFAVSYTGCAILCAGWLLGSLTGRFRFGPFSYGLRANLACVLAILAFTAVWCALFCLLSAGGRNRALTVVLAFALWFALILAGSGLLDRLNEPRESGGWAYIDGQFVEEPLHPNPLYIGGTLRTVLGIIAYTLPGSLSILINDYSLDRPFLAAALSMGFAAVLLGLGLLRFRKKDLK